MIIYAAVNVIEEKTCCNRRRANQVPNFVRKVWYLLHDFDHY